MDIHQINEQLGLNVIANGMTYIYTTTDPHEDFQVDSQWPGTDAFTVRITEVPIDQDAGSGNLNPCCADGDDVCPSLLGCAGP